jgi:reverse gyrase
VRPGLLRTTYLILPHTIGKRLRKKTRQVKETMRRMMHRPITEQALHLRRVMNGYFNYFAVPTTTGRSTHSTIMSYGTGAARSGGGAKQAD